MGNEICAARASGAVKNPTLNALLVESGYLYKRFRNIKVIGQGGFGVVYEVTDPIENMRYAVKKIILPDKPEDYRLECAEREVRSLAQFRGNKHIVNYITAWVEKPRKEDEVHLFIQMELAEDDLMEWIIVRNEKLSTVRNGRNIFDEMKLDFLAAFKHFFKIVWSVNFLHEKGYIHRDLKPPNLLFVRGECNEMILKLADMGLSKIVGGSKGMHTLGVGTPLFAAPEVIKDGDKAAYNSKADMYSIGSIMLLLFHPVSSVKIFAQLLERLEKPEGRLKFRFPYPVEKLFPESRELLFKLLEMKPRNRISSRELLKNLCQYVASHGEVDWKRVLGSTFSECEELLKEVRAFRSPGTGGLDSNELSSKSIDSRSIAEKSDQPTKTKMPKSMNALEIHSLIAEQHILDISIVFAELENLDISVDLGNVLNENGIATKILNNPEFFPKLKSLDLSGRKDVSIDELMKFLNYNKMTQSRPALDFLGLFETSKISSDDITRIRSMHPDLVITGTATEEQLLEALKQYKHRGAYILKALEYLRQLLETCSEPKEDVIEQIIVTMESHGKSRRIQYACLLCLQLQMRNKPRTKLGLLERIGEATVKAMEEFHSDKNVLAASLSILRCEKILTEGVEFESPVIIKKLLKMNGLNLLITLLDIFSDKPDIERDILGILGNIAKNSSLRKNLMNDELLRKLGFLLHSSNMLVRFQAGGIIAQLSSDESMDWKTKNVSRRVILKNLAQVISRWVMPEKELVSYESFVHLHPLLSNEDATIQLWAVSAIQYFCRVNPKKCCEMIMKEDLLPLITKIMLSTAKSDNLLTHRLCNSIIEICEKCKPEKDVETAVKSAFVTSTPPCSERLQDPDHLNAIVGHLTKPVPSPRIVKQQHQEQSSCEITSDGDHQSKPDAAENDLSLYDSWQSSNSNELEWTTSLAEGCTSDLRELLKELREPGK